MHTVIVDDGISNDRNWGQDEIFSTQNVNVRIVSNQKATLIR